MRLLALTGVVLVALVGAGSASADITPPEFNPSADDQFWDIVNEDFDPLSPEAQDALDRLPDMTPEERDEYLEKWKDGDADAKMRSRRWPRLRAFGGSILVSVAASVGFDYALKMEIPGQGFIYSLITGESYSGSGSAMTNTRWVCLGSSPCPLGSVSAFPGTVNTGWLFRSDQDTDVLQTAAGYGPTATCYYAGTTANGQLCLAAKTLPLTTWQGNCDGSACGAFVKRTDDQMEAALELRASDATEYAATTNKLDAGEYTPPTATTGDKEAAWDHGDTTNVSNEWRDYIYIRMNPEADYSGSYSVPQPLPNETYTAYISRLQSLGWYGSATSTERGTEHEDYGPSAIVRLTVQDSTLGTTRILDPIRWPSTNPTSLKSEDISLIYNPATATEVAEGTGSTPITAPPTTVPGTPAVDFTPITNLDPGCKFPYGFICYAVDFTEQFDVAADAPVFSFVLGIDQTLCEGCEAPYVVDLEVMDDYMALWRGILTVVLWVGAIYLVATRMLGFKAGGDPGEAIDDVL